MAHQRLLCVALLAALVFAPAPAAAADYGGLAGEACDLDSECMSRKCVGNACAPTTCGLPVDQGGKGEGTGFCTNLYTTFNGNRVCTFGFNQCTRAECCDTLTCDAGVLNANKVNLCDAGTNFAGSRLCLSTGCRKEECCTTTQCDGPGGVPVGDRATFCSTGEAFDNTGICAGGQGACTQSECCQPNVRTCSVALAQLGLSCTAPAVIKGDRIYDTSADQYGGCCETTTCATGVEDSAKAGYCQNLANTQFSGVEACTSNGSCLDTDCCKTPQQFCTGTGTQWNAQTNTCGCTVTGKVFVPGTGCVCGAGKFTTGSNTCDDCPHGTYSVEPSAATSCTSCPDSVPYTAGVGSTNVTACYNYCDRWLLDNENSICSNGGACSSKSGDNVEGSFECTCPSTWMSNVADVKDNCNAPTTLLRLRVLAASGVTLPNGFALSVNDVAKAGEADWVAQATNGALTCTVASPTSTPTVPTCTGITYSLSVSTGNEARTRSLLNTKVRLSTNYVGTAFDIAWACSDGTGTAPGIGAFNVVLPGPAALNPNGQTLVCTAIVRSADVPFVQLKLAENTLVPDPATNTRDAQLTFVQGTRPICVAAATSSVNNLLECPYSDLPLATDSPGILGVSNIDMEKYKVTWSCKVGSEAAISPPTNALGVATSPNLPAAGQTLVCEATFLSKRKQVALTATSAASSDITLTAIQAGMTEPCVATIPVGSSAPVISCPVGNLKSGFETTLRTNANLTQYLVEFSCNNRTPLKSRASAIVTSSGDGQGDDTTCSVSITALPALLEINIVNTVAPAFTVIASQRTLQDACIWSSGTKSCTLSSDGVMPSLTTTLTPRGLDVDEFQVAWLCTGRASANPVPNSLTNTVSVVLDVNPNSDLDFATVVCTGTVTPRTNPVNVQMVVSGATGFVATSAELLVRQSHQKQACTATNPTSVTAPTCTEQALRATLGTKTTLSTRNVNTTAYKVSWACVGDGASRDTTIVAAAVATVETMGPTTPLTCTATITAKPALLLLKTSGTGPKTAWSLTARQSMQGRACSVAATDGQVGSATAPTCTVQPFLPTRSTVLATSGLDLSRYSVGWACSNSTHADLSMSDVSSSTGINLANSKSVTLGRDANVGGGPVTCIATVTPLVGVLELQVSGPLPTNAMLTAKQSTQTQACTFAVSATAGVPTCSGGVDISRGLSVELGATGLGTGYYVSGWACFNTDVVPVTQRNGAATIAALPASGVTTCTATIVSSVVPIVLLGPSAGGVTFTARQGANTFCTFTSGSTSVPCTGAAASTATTLVAADNTNPATFACTVGSTSVPVSRLTAASSIVMAPPAGIQMTCTVTLAVAPIITLTSNLPTTLKVEYIGAESKTCASVPFSRSVTCNKGTGSNEFTAGTRVKLSQQGLTAVGHYRWMCGSSAAAIERAMVDNKVVGDHTASATVELPSTGTLSCNLMYWSSKPGFIRDRRMMM